MRGTRRDARTRTTVCGMCVGFAQIRQALLVKVGRLWGGWGLLFACVSRGGDNGLLGCTMYYNITMRSPYNTISSRAEDRSLRNCSDRRPPHVPS